MGDDPKDFDFDFNTPLSSTIIRPRGPVAFHALPSMHSERWRCQILIHISTQSLPVFITRCSHHCSLRRCSLRRRSCRCGVEPGVSNHDLLARGGD